ncbi:MAG: hypothetical protein AABO57_18885 [Acidobacteriota bacterium]
MCEPGKLFVFEGPDNSGKTTLSIASAEYFRSKGIECDYFAFPGREIGTLGTLVYGLHHDPQSRGVQAITPTSLQLLHIAAHVDAIESKILPALKIGRNVVLDRFWWSTLVYGRVAGANRAALGRMVDLEQACWANHSPEGVFLIQRSNPITAPATDDWKAVSQEYAEVAAQEANRYPVWYVENNGGFADALSQVVKHIYLDRELSEADGSTTADRYYHPASTEA